MNPINCFYNIKKPKYYEIHKKTLLRLTQKGNFPRYTFELVSEVNNVFFRIIEKIRQVFGRNNGVGGVVIRVENSMLSREITSFKVTKQSFCNQLGISVASLNEYLKEKNTNDVSQFLNDFIPKKFEKQSCDSCDSLVKKDDQLIKEKNNLHLLNFYKKGEALQKKGDYQGAVHAFEMAAFANIKDKNEQSKKIMMEAKIFLAQLYFIGGFGIEQDLDYARELISLHQDINIMQNENIVIELIKLLESIYNDEKNSDSLRSITAWMLGNILSDKKVIVEKGNAKKAFNYYLSALDLSKKAQLSSIKESAINEIGFDIDKLKEPFLHWCHFDNANPEDIRRPAALILGLEFNKYLTNLDFSKYFHAALDLEKKKHPNTFMPFAYNELGRMYYEGKGTEKNAQLAFESYLAAAQLGNGEAGNNLTEIFLENPKINLDENSLKFCIDLWVKEVKEDNFQAIEALNHFLDANSILKKEFKKYEKVILNAYYNIGKYFQMKRKIDQSIDWWTKAGLNGHLTAANEIKKIASSFGIFQNKKTITKAKKAHKIILHKRYADHFNEQMADV